MSGEGRDLVIKKQLTALGVTKTDQDYGLSLASRTLIDSYNTEQSLFANAGEMAGLEDLQLLDPLTGFMIITDGGRAKNFWLGNQRDMVEIQNQPEEVVKLLLQTKSDHFCIGKNLLMKAVGPMTKRRRNISYDPSGIPTFIVQTQTELEELATEITEACAALPFGVTAYFRGQSSEHLLPDRRGLIEAGVCEYSDVRDHSLIPPLYRHYDSFTNEPGDFREFVSHLLEWNLHGNLALGDPGSYLTIDGKPHTPKSVSREALASRTMNVKGSLQSQRMFEAVGTYTHWKISESGKAVDEYIKFEQPGFDLMQRNLIMQHYGAPTPFLSVTTNIQVAEWFAFNKLEVASDGLVMADSVRQLVKDPVIYVLFALEGLTPHVKTESLLANEQSLRIQRQSCATIGGAGNLYRNSASRFIGLKLKFAENFRPKGLPDARHLFPGPDEDETLKKLLDSVTYGSLSKPIYPVYWFPG